METRPIDEIVEHLSAAQRNVADAREIAKVLENFPLDGYMRMLDAIVQHAVRAVRTWRSFESGE